MTNCNQIKRLIDEAEQPESLPFEASHHLNACAPCRQFADERAGLRALLNGIPRVNAPINFDSQLKARLTTAKAKPTFAWLSPALYMRFGAASAVLLIAVFAAQYNGLFSLNNNQADTGNTPNLEAGNSFAPTPMPVPLVEPQSSSPRPPQILPAPVAIAATPNRVGRRVQPVAVRLEADSVTARVPGVILRRSGEEVELPMLPVSLGAQQQLINRSGRSSVQPIAISF